MELIKSTSKTSVNFPIDITINWYDDPEPDLSHIDDPKFIKSYEEGKWKMLMLIVTASYGMLEAKNSVYNIASSLDDEYKSNLIKEAIAEVKAEILEKINHRLRTTPVIEDGIIKWKLLTS